METIRLEDQVTGKHLRLLVAAYFHLASRQSGICLPHQWLGRLGVEFTELYSFVEKCR